MNELIPYNAVYAERQRAQFERYEDGAFYIFCVFVCVFVLWFCGGVALDLADLGTDFSDSGVGCIDDCLDRMEE